TRLAQVLQDIKAEQTTLTYESSLTADLETELDKTRRRLTELTMRLGALAEASQQAEAELTTAETQASGQRADVTGKQGALDETAGRIAALNRQISTDKNEHLEQMRRAAHLQNEAVASKAHVDNLHRERQRLQHRSQQAAETLASVD